MKRTMTRGFTLIELLIVVAIIGVLTTLLTANLLNAQQRGRDTKRKSDLKAIQSALEQYFADYKHYPCTNVNVKGWIDSSAGSAWITDDATSGTGCGGTAFSPAYMNTIPTDPLPTGNTVGQPMQGKYTYAYWSGNLGGNCLPGRYYLLTAHLENSNDSDRLAITNVSSCGHTWLTEWRTNYPAANTPDVNSTLLYINP